MFEKFLNKIDKLDEDENKKNGETINIVEILLEIVSILIVLVGIVWGIVAISKGEAGFAIIVCSLLTALFVRALAEIINLLQGINDKLGKK